MNKYHLFLSKSLELRVINWQPTGQVKLTEEFLLVCTVLPAKPCQHFKPGNFLLKIWIWLLLKKSKIPGPDFLNDSHLLRQGEGWLGTARFSMLPQKTPISSLSPRAGALCHLLLCLYLHFTL